MTVDDDRVLAAVDPVTGTPFRLEHAVASLYSDLRLTPTLHCLLARTRELVDGVAGSISVIDRETGTYSKVAERGIPCRLGSSFPLTDGATGRAVAHGGPVVIDDYSALRTRHLPPDHPANHGSVAAVPIWWRGDLIGVNVTFTGRRQRFTTEEIDRLEVLTQSAAGAIVTAAAGDPSLARLIRDRPRAPGGPATRTTVTEVGDARPVSPVVARAAADLVLSAEQAASREDRASALHVAIVHRVQGLRLLIQEEGGAAHRDTLDRLSVAVERALLTLVGGAAQVEHVPGWGTLVRADLPYAQLGDGAGSGGAPPGVVLDGTPVGAASPLTAREAEVLGLVAQGLGDREIARRLVLSPKTVEKHVGSAIRKSGTTSRTGAAVHALERGWI